MEKIYKVKDPPKWAFSIFSLSLPCFCLRSNVHNLPFLSSPQCLLKTYLLLPQHFSFSSLFSFYQTYSPPLRVLVYTTIVSKRGFFIQQKKEQTLFLFCIISLMISFLDFLLQANCNIHQKR